MDKNSFLGPTGNFPDGKLDSSDEGEIRFTVFIRDLNNIVIDFGDTPLSWISLHPSLALQLSEILQNKANYCLDAINSKAN